MAQRYPKPPRRPRRGISLTEVLISVFIILVGVMGVAAVLSGGHHQARMGTIKERATLALQFALADFRARGFAARLPADTHTGWLRPEWRGANAADGAQASVRIAYRDDPRLSYRYVLRPIPGGRDHEFMLFVEVYLQFVETNDAGNPMPAYDPTLGRNQANYPVLLHQEPMRIETVSLWSPR